MNLILDQIVLTLDQIVLKLNPIPPRQELGLTIYRLAKWDSCNTLAALFHLSAPCVNGFFKRICRTLVSKLHDQYIHLPETKAEWGVQSRGISIKLQILCVGAWDRLQVHVNSNLKNYFTFKKWYLLANLGLLCFRDRFI